MSEQAPDSVKVGEYLWVAVYEHKYGMDTHAFTTHAEAEGMRRRIADWFWEAEMGDLPKPEDPEEMADAYFNEMGDHGEFFNIQQVPLQGAS